MGIKLKISYMFFLHNHLLFNSVKIFLTIFPVENISFYNNEITLTVEAKHILNVLKFLKQHSHCQYHVLVSLTAVDYLQQQNRFELNYELLSLTFNNRLRIKIYLNELELINSCENLFSAASWYECDVWNLLFKSYKFKKNINRLWF